MQKISVIIPTYKNRGGLLKSIESALNQHWDNLEVLVIDDNQPDSPERTSTELLMKEFEYDSRVIYIKHTQNKNGAAARNTGINASKGEYIAFLDDDDWFLEGKLTKQCHYLQEHPEFDAVYCLACKSGKIFSTTFYEGRPIKEMLMLDTCMYTPCLMFRRQPLLSINGFDEALRRHQDYDLLLRFFHEGYSIGCLKDILTEIGTNEAENSPSGVKLENLKSYFFSKFDKYIDEINEKEPGFKKSVYAKHYAKVFLRHLRYKDYMMAIKTLCKYFFYSPKQFIKVINYSIKYHLS